MNVKGICLGGLVATLLGLGAARAQDAALPYTTAPDTAPAPGALNGEPVPPVGPPGQVSRWMLYERPTGCCGPVGKNGPIGYDLYFFSGVALIAGDSALGHVLDNGWTIGGGARSLFFNPDYTRAWTIDGAIQNTYHYGGEPHTLFPLFNVAELQESPFGSRQIVTRSASVAVKSLNQTIVRLGVGREWWLTGSADICTDHVNWRVGVDAGGHWGSAKAETTEFRNRTDVIGGVQLSAHSDVEIPWGNCMFFFGLKAEWMYTWSDILQSSDADLQHVFLVGTLGLRF